MYLEHLNLYNFKNHSEGNFKFGNEVNCFTGFNGSGKTNVLDAIYYLCMCRSYFHSSDSLNIKNGEQFFAIHGVFNTGSTKEDIYCGLKQGQRKIVKRNNKEYNRLADHIGLFPVVMIAPVDQELITGGSEERRKLIDSVLCQTDRTYLDNLTAYQRVLQQRNALLKNNQPDDSLSIWDEQLVQFGKEIYLKRKVFSEEMMLLFPAIYNQITGNSESGSFNYISQLAQADMAELLKTHYHRDRVLQYTSTGIHKDDFNFMIENTPVKRFGSQGQQKSFVISLKLAVYQYILQTNKTLPILLLDDIFEKLDDRRMNNLLTLVSGQSFGQLFITDTHQGRPEAVFGKLNKNVVSYHLPGTTLS
jgi:DNA replication and repair protein RecF